MADKKENNKPLLPNKPPRGNYQVWVILATLAVIFGVMYFSNSSNLQDLNYDDFKTMVSNGDVKKVVLVQNRKFVEVTLKPEALNNIKYKDDLNKGMLSTPNNSGPHYIMHVVDAGNFDQEFDLTLAPPVGTYTLNLVSSCIWGNDVLDPVVSALNAQPSAYYEDVGSHGPYVAGVFTPRQDGKFYESIVDGWDPRHLVGQAGSPSWGRIGYYFRVADVLRDAATCFANAEPLIPLDVPGGGQLPRLDFMQLRNNPFLTGRAIVHLGLAHADRVTARIYDVGGRLVRTLADRNFPAGEHDLAWDGTDDGGRRLERGVYFTQLAYAKSGFMGAKKLILLR